ncbi:MAG: preprotein translocase subunit YajC [Deltaproteobacteria bacterium]|nr:preprotein translocase subunit YajC [Deltaproteobacteria bacterium]
MDLLSLIAQAQGKGGGSAVPGCGGGGIHQLALMALMFLVFYFLLIRPQQKRAKDHREMLSNLRRGDRIITVGGICGTITGLTDRFVTVELAEKIRVRVLRSHVQGKEAEAEAEQSDDKKD